MIGRLLLWALIGVLCGCAAAFAVRRFANTYEGSYLVGGFWLLILVVLTVGGLLCLVTRARALGIGLTIMAGGLVIGFGLTSALVPAKELTTADVYGGQHLRIVFRSDATDKDIEAFVCGHVYRDCAGTERAFADGISRVSHSGLKEVLVWADLSRQSDFVSTWQREKGVQRVEGVF